MLTIDYSLSRLKAKRLQGDQKILVSTVAKVVCGVRSLTEQFKLRNIITGKS